jgi:tRNA pseudouridine32 synthase / 23S rRNA pseudouridine746 synthase
MALTIIYEDADIIALNKPCGQAVIPGRNLGDAVPLVKEVEEYLKTKAFVVHRLDRLTSGIILFAKNADTHRNLCMQFEAREIEKRYLALCLGKVERNGVVDKPLHEFGSGRMGIAKGGQEAFTEYRVLKRLAGVSLLEIMPRTGRKHQIRVHLYSIGHPVLGDPLYGQERPVGGASRLMLHASRICFNKPDGTILKLETETDETWKTVLEKYPD